MLLALDVFHQVFPVLLFLDLLFIVRVEGLHLERFTQFWMPGAHVCAVAASQTVHHGWLDDKVHAFHGCRRLHLDGFSFEAFQLFVVQHEWADGCVWADV